MCGDCLAEWIRVAKGDCDESSGDEGMEDEEDEFFSNPQVCHLCRAAVVAWRIGPRAAEG